MKSKTSDDEKFSKLNDFPNTSKSQSIYRLCLSRSRDMCKLW